MMMQWFGKSWHSPINDSCPQVDIPIGKECEHCGVKFKEGDRGVIIPSMEKVDDEYKVGRVAYHLLCWMHETIGGMLARRVYNMLAEREGF